LKNYWICIMLCRDMFIQRQKKMTQKKSKMHVFDPRPVISDQKQENYGNTFFREIIEGEKLLSDGFS